MATKLRALYEKMAQEMETIQGFKVPGDYRDLPAQALVETFTSSLDTRLGQIQAIVNAQLPELIEIARSEDSDTTNTP